MEFASPAVLGFLAAVPLILLFGLWQTRPARVTVPGLDLWARIRERNPPVRELRRPAFRAALVLQALAAACLVAALAGPRQVAPAPQGRTLFLLVDDTASMGARALADGSARTRWDLACEAAAGTASRCAPADRVILFPGHAAGARHETSPAGVAERLRAYGPSACGEAALVETARMAVAEAGDRPGRVLVFITDHAEAEGPESGGPGPGSGAARAREGRTAAGVIRTAGGSVVTVGAPVRNAGITAFSAEAVPDAGGGAAGGVRLFVAGRGPGNETLRATLDASDDGLRWGAPLTVVDVPLDGAGTGMAVATLEPAPRSRVLRARLEGGDGLAADDTAWAVDPGERAPVVYVRSTEAPVSPGAGGVLRALQSVAGLPVEVQAAPGGRPGDPSPRARLVVYDGVAPERLAEGRWVALVNPPGPVGPFETGSPAPAAPDAWRRAPPLTDHVDLEAIRVWRARPCRFTGPVEELNVIVGAPAGPVLARWDRAGGPVLYAGFDMTWRGAAALSDSAWALEPGFAIFWKNVVDAVYSARDPAAGGGWRAGRTCAAAGAGDFRAAGHRAGVQFVRGDVDDEPADAANLFDEAESWCPSGGGMEPGAFRLPPAPAGRQVRSLAEGLVAAAAALLIAAWLMAARSGP